MKRIQYFFIGSLLITLVGACKDDPIDQQAGTLTLHFKAVYDGQPLQTFTVHPFEGVQQIQFALLSTYISDISLFDASSEIHVQDIELVNMGFDDAQAAAAGYTLTLENVPAASYDGIRFGIGVPPDQNAKKPADFPSSSPLSKTGYYWQGWNSFIFMKTEGTLDSVGNGVFDLGYAIHCGSDPLFRSLEGNVPLLIENGKNTELTIVFDYKKLLEGVDIKSHPQNHTLQDTSEILKIVNNLDSAISLIK